MTTMTLPAPLAKLVAWRFGLGFLVLALVFFGSAGTLRYWQAWMYLVTLLVPLAFALAYLVRNDPELLARRMKTREKESTQRKVILGSVVFFVAAFGLPGFDVRLGWSQVPPWVSVVADALALAGYLLVIRVFKENTYASRVVEVESGQKVISTGPYSVVRHPMYVGSLCMYLLSPVALGSYWAVIPAAFLIWVLVARIRNEEQVLRRELAGYEAYCARVKFRLVPGVW